ncbi:hypothetical protein GCM10020221_31460 [Streptomyces thioluteus]|uniref:Uncharacterized protein n=1 Tax=Streptomyces thioluteus TaxID=66431 RepID=A0ABP6JK40_STRTU
MPAGSAASAVRTAATGRGVRLQRGHLVPGAGQPQGLGAVGEAHVQDAQPPPDREAAAYLLVELPADELVADRVP